MFDIGWSELLVIAVVAIIVVGPKDLPRLMRTFGHYAGKLRRAASEFQRQFEDAMREAELEEVRKAMQSVRDAAPSLDLGAPIHQPVMLPKSTPDSGPAAPAAAALTPATAEATARVAARKTSGKATPRSKQPKAKAQSSAPKTRASKAPAPKMLASKAPAPKPPASKRKKP
jgi:sec-independent protein translocase protein TatB